MSMMFPTCNADNGFYPGAAAGAGPSTYLKGLDDKIKEGTFVAAIYSIFDDLIEFGD
jgi:hypothetical protein